MVLYPTHCLLFIQHRTYGAPLKQAFLINGTLTPGSPAVNGKIWGHFIQQADNILTFGTLFSVFIYLFFRSKVSSRTSEQVRLACL